MNGYQAFYNGKTADVYADSLWAAKQKAIDLFKVPRSKQSMVSVVLCEVAGKEVEVSTSSI